MIEKEKLEEELVRQLVKRDNRFAEPVKVKGKGKQTRKMEDLTFLKNLLNVKFGFKKKGQPNMVAFNRFAKRFVNKEIDSYWILSIDGANNHVCFFNLYEQLDYTNTNLGTGQVMLNEGRFYSEFNQDNDYTIDRNNVIMKLIKIVEIMEIQKGFNQFENTYIGSKQKIVLYVTNKFQQKVKNLC